VSFQTPGAALTYFGPTGDELEQLDFSARDGGTLWNPASGRCRETATEHSAELTPICSPNSVKALPPFRSLEDFPAKQDRLTALCEFAATPTRRAGVGNV
jgi:hypothetical protein